jgi:hypothetical protein
VSRHVPVRCPSPPAAPITTTLSPAVTLAFLTTLAASQSISHQADSIAKLRVTLEAHIMPCCRCNCDRHLLIFCCRCAGSLSSPPTRGSKGCFQTVKRNVTVYHLFRQSTPQSTGLTLSAPYNCMHRMPYSPSSVTLSRLRRLRFEVLCASPRKLAPRDRAEGAK